MKRESSTKDLVRPINLEDRLNELISLPRVTEIHEEFLRRLDEKNRIVEEIFDRLRRTEVSNVA